MHISLSFRCYCASLIRELHCLPVLQMAVLTQDTLPQSQSAAGPTCSSAEAYQSLYRLPLLTFHSNYIPILHRL